MDLSTPLNMYNGTPELVTIEIKCQQLSTNELNLCKAIEEYLKTLSPKQYKAYEIARDHLKDSFQIEKSNGFLRWVKKNQIAI